MTRSPVEGKPSSLSSTRFLVILSARRISRSGSHAIASPRTAGRGATTWGRPYRPTDRNLLLDPDLVDLLDEVIAVEHLLRHALDALGVEGGRLQDQDVEKRHVLRDDLLDLLVDGDPLLLVHLGEPLLEELIDLRILDVREVVGALRAELVG